MQKPRLSFWQIWNMSFGFMGIQFGWGLQLPTEGDYNSWEHQRRDPSGWWSYDGVAGSASVAR